MEDKLSEEELREMESNSFKDDEYNSLTWGSKQNIIDLLQHIRRLERERIMINELSGIPITRIQELIDLFMEAGYDLKNDEHFKFIKRDYFKKIE